MTRAWDTVVETIQDLQEGSMAINREYGSWSQESMLLES